VSLDLVLSSARDSAVTRVIERGSKIPSTVDPIAWTLAVLPPRFVDRTGNFIEELSLGLS
jgi:hypothetical protein